MKSVNKTIHKRNQLVKLRQVNSHTQSINHNKTTHKRNHHIISQQKNNNIINSKKETYKRVTWIKNTNTYTHANNSRIEAERQREALKSPFVCREREREGQRKVLELEGEKKLGQIGRKKVGVYFWWQRCRREMKGFQWKRYSISPVKSPLISTEKTHKRLRSLEKESERRRKEIRLGLREILGIFNPFCL